VGKEALGAARVRAVRSAHIVKGGALCLRIVWFSIDQEVR
jgi:hypothetical protein